MSSSNLPILLAGVAIVLGLASLWLFYRVVIKPRQAAKPTTPAPSPAPQKTPDAAAPTPKKPAKTQKPAQQCLFVVFDAPSQAINQALGEMLKEKKAFYEAELGAFHLPPGPKGYPLMVASATSPGKLPPLHEGGEHAPVQGISILIRFLNARKVSRSPDDLIAFTHEVAELGGHILDAKREPITEETLAEMRREDE
ncbi:cell division protein ZipA C-terminal FtsZ-binding domain-containing protein [Halomonas vilamensis]|uniref:Cell division protein ZipA n=1 Tax=Vreelandella vilamensis TaxID=531309 RepID=A0ABU1H595_9GAMM|nr:cell division protein ZipA C-terminal FtsZ-binding domain-containing protein [Halomonas vilamensis]MDR5899474.1 cell division protein ZipA C-terminal FtsZ-binding domain-containing protein [Halomonas vilamensis]